MEDILAAFGGVLHDAVGWTFRGCRGFGRHGNKYVRIESLCPLYFPVSVFFLNINSFVTALKKEDIQKSQNQSVFSL